MKKIKTVLSFILMLSLGVSLLALPAFAVTADDNDVSVIVSDGENEDAIDLSKCTLLLSETITLVTDENGKVTDIVEGDLPSVCGTITSNTSNRVVTVNFYKSGSTYYVALTAKAKPDRWWIETLELSFRPKNFSDWDTTKRSPLGKQNTCTIIGKFSYPNGTPSNVTVEVKWYIHTAGEYALEDFFGWSKTYTLDNP